MISIPANNPLWQRLCAWSPDDPDAAVPFSMKLANEQRWSADFARRAIEAYRRFVFLCCTSPHGASPSPVVDAVWHLHLTYTVEYWQRFCPAVLQRELHHHPSRGGPTEKEHHQRWYAETLRCYEEAFGEPPPADLWPPPPAGQTAPGPDNHRRRARPVWLLLLLPSLMTGILYGQPFPFLLKGSQFLLYFAVSGILVLRIVFNRLQQLAGQLAIGLANSGALSETEAAYLTGGPQRVDLLLLGGLIREEALVHVTGTSGYRLHQQRLQSSESPLSGPLMLLCDCTVLSFDRLRRHARPFADAARLRLRPLERPYWARLAHIASWLLFPVLLFAVRWAQALLHDRPHGYLLLSGAALFAASLLLLCRHTFRAAATRLLREQESVTEAIRNDFSREVIFSGVTALAGWTVLYHLRQQYRPGESGSSCGGGGGDCGSSCGGGCGGCGGCGGGD